MSVLIRRKFIHWYIILIKVQLHVDFGILLIACLYDAIPIKANRQRPKRMGGPYDSELSNVIAKRMLTAIL